MQVCVCMPLVHMLMFICKQVSYFMFHIYYAFYQEDNLFPQKNKMYRYSVKMTYNRNIYYLIIKEWKNSEFVWTLKNKSFLTDSSTYRDMIYSFLNTKKYIPCFHPSNKELPSLTCRLEKQKIAVKIQTLFATISTFLKVFFKNFLNSDW